MVVTLSQPFGPTLRCLRKARKLTQARLAERLSLGSSYLSMLECGKKIPSEKAARQIASALDLSSKETLSLLEAQRRSSIRISLPKPLNAIEAILLEEFKTTLPNFVEEMTGILLRSLRSRAANKSAVLEMWDKNKEGF